MPCQLPKAAAHSFAGTVNLHQHFHLRFQSFVHFDDWRPRAFKAFAGEFLRRVYAEFAAACGFAGGLPTGRQARSSTSAGLLVKMLSRLRQASARQARCGSAVARMGSAGAAGRAAPAPVQAQAAAQAKGQKKIAEKLAPIFGGFYSEVQ
ncbi:MAG: hypothetical protein HYY24_25740 [Verrucomicrobia bacterium]|nr:hypothetical protein [Verrucomicrobiota bacterium]